jgi:hypothetical protein
MMKMMTTRVLVSTISSVYILSFCSFMSPSRAALFASLYFFRPPFLYYLFFCFYRPEMALCW